MNHLLRSLAPISDSGWKELDDEARERLAPALAARRPARDIHQHRHRPDRNRAAPRLRFRLRLSRSY